LPRLFVFCQNLLSRLSALFLDTRRQLCSQYFNLAPPGLALAHQFLDPLLHLLLGPQQSRHLYFSPGLGLGLHFRVYLSFLSTRVRLELLPRQGHPRLRLNLFLP